MRVSVWWIPARRAPVSTLPEARGSTEYRGVDEAQRNPPNYQQRAAHKVRLSWRH